MCAVLHSNGFPRKKKEGKRLLSLCPYAFSRFALAAKAAKDLLRAIYEMCSAISPLDTAKAQRHR